MTDLLVGCPVRARTWILGQWMDYVLRAAEGLDIGFVFVCGLDDEETYEFVQKRGMEASHPPVILRVPERKRPDQRAWTLDRYEHMVFLRNELLGQVRKVEPKAFLSLDSDILIHPQAIKNMLELLNEADAVGSKAFMASGTWCPSWATLTLQESLERDNSNDVLHPQIIMAIKMMSPRAYNIDYEYHHQGEDIGWSLACEKAGLKFAWDGRVCSKHVMEEQQLHLVDQRCGY